MKEVADLNDEKSQVCERIKDLEEKLKETEGAIQEVEADTKAVDSRAEEMHQVTLEQVRACCSGGRPSSIHSFVRACHCLLRHKISQD